MAMIEGKMGQIASGVAQGFGATATLDFREIFAPLVNAAEETELVADVAASIVGEANIDRRRPPIMASEDFSYMLEACPGAYINIGNGNQEGYCQVHNHHYDFNDEILALGASYWARLVEKKLEKEPL